MSYDFDLFVIGGGSGGVRAARVAAQTGANVAIVEEYRYGGTCVIRGCVPKKLFVYASEMRHEIEDAAGFGWSVPEATFDWNTLRDNKDKEIDRLNKIYIALLEKHDVKVMHGRGTLTDAHTVDVGGTSYTAETILIATGATPYLPDTHGIGNAITSNEAFHLTELPSHVTVVGGGYIAIEFAQIFNGFGCDVSLVHRRDLLLRGFDHDVRTTVTRNLASHGIELHLPAEVDGVDRRSDGTLRVSLSTGKTIDTKAYFCATGRRPNTAGLGLEAIGIDLDPVGAIVVDDYSRTAVPNVYAVGDVTNRVNLTPVAIREGQAFADTVYNEIPRKPDYRCVPTAVFSQPPTASCGLTESLAREEYGAIDVYRSVFRPMRHTLSGRDEKTMMKLVVDRRSQRVLGAHMVGLDAAEIIQALAVAIHMKATKADLDATTAIHPTTAEEFVLMRTPVEDD
jgi:glutathione reductase (NADPH)